MSSIKSTQEIMLEKFFALCTEEEFNTDNQVFREYISFIYETLTRPDIRNLLEKICIERISVFSKLANTTLQECITKFRGHEKTKGLLDFTDKDLLKFIDAYETIQGSDDIVDSLNRQTLDFSMGSILVRTSETIILNSLSSSSNPTDKRLSSTESIFLKYILTLLSSNRDTLHNIKTINPMKITSLCGVMSVRSFKGCLKYYRFPSEKTLNPVLFRKPNDYEVMNGILQQNCNSEVVDKRVSTSPNLVRPMVFGFADVSQEVQEDNMIFEDRVAECITKYLIACIVTIYQRVKYCTPEDRSILFDSTLLDLHTKNN